MWRDPPDKLLLTKDQVHVWRAYLDCGRDFIKGIGKTLSSDEKRRAKRFYFRKDQYRYIATRGVLRNILSLYVDSSPKDLRFCYSDYGKPYLSAELNPGQICFNQTHSRGLAVYAVTRSRKVGIDVEYMNQNIEGEKIAKKFFSPRENAMLRSVPEKNKKEAFFNCWTRKEAYVKARGEGLSIPLDQFDVSMFPGEPASLLNINDSPDEVSNWVLEHIFADEHYACALATEGNSLKFKFWLWKS
jgi:4'-phosphopantetheinyl transferase